MTDSKRAFELKANVEDFAGGTFAYGEGHTFDIAAALDENNGVIVVEDPILIESLSNIDILKNAKVPEGAEATPPPGERVATLTVPVKEDETPSTPNAGEGSGQGESGTPGTTSAASGRSSEPTGSGR